MKAKKSLGQNFLKSKSIIKKMIEVSNLSKKDLVIEVGPGKGILTKELLRSGAEVLAIEKDDQLFEFLNEKFLEEIKNKKLKLIHEDVMDLDFEKISKKDFKIVANIPYNITGGLIRKIFEERNLPKQIVLMVQKEVAERIVARDKKESILSLSVKAYGEPRYVTKVKKEFFSPKPKVDSAIISIENISKKNFANKKSEEKFFEYLKAGFAHKRKKLSSNLKSLDKNIEAKLESLKLNKNTRPEDVSLSDWIKIIS